MAESLEDFLGQSVDPRMIEVNGSMTCQTCYEVVHKGYLNEDSMTLNYRCSNNHDSQAKI